MITVTVRNRVGKLCLSNASDREMCRWKHPVTMCYNWFITSYKATDDRLTSFWRAVLMSSDRNLVTEMLASLWSRAQPAIAHATSGLTLVLCRKDSGHLWTHLHTHIQYISTYRSKSSDQFFVLKVGSHLICGSASLPSTLTITVYVNWWDNKHSLPSLWLLKHDTY